MSRDEPKPSPEAAETLAALKRAVANTLERKKRLGQYAVVWRNGKPAVLDESADDSALFSEELHSVAVSAATKESSVAEQRADYRPDDE